MGFSFFVLVSVHLSDDFDLKIQPPRGADAHTKTASPGMSRNAARVFFVGAGGAAIAWRGLGRTTTSEPLQPRSQAAPRMRSFLAPSFAFADADEKAVDKKPIATTAMASQNQELGPAPDASLPA